MDWIKAIGVDGDDAKVIAVALVAVLVVGVGLIIVAAFLGVAVNVFSLASGLG